LPSLCPTISIEGERGNTVLITARRGAHAYLSEVMGLFFRTADHVVLRRAGVDNSFFPALEAGLQRKTLPEKLCSRLSPTAINNFSV